MVDEASVPRVIGCWSWSKADSALVRHDGAFLRLLGPAGDEVDATHGHWFRFRIGHPEGETPLLVQHRLVGFHGQYRVLQWRADFTRFEAAGAEPPASYRQWTAIERIAADGLACWPEHIFGERSDFVAVEGGWRDGAFRSDRYRLYERSRVVRFLPGGRLPEEEAAERHWRFQPLDPAIAAPSRSDLAKPRSASALRDGLARMIERGPALIAEDCAILLEEDQYGSLHATYVDEDFVSDRYMITGLYRGQEDRWGVGDYAKVAIGARRLRDLRAAEKDAVGGFIGLFFPIPPRRNHRGGEYWAADPLLVERAGRSFAEALFHVPSGAFSERRVVAPPLLVALTKAWFQAGYLESRMSVARSVQTDEFIAAFSDAPPPEMSVQPRPGVPFDLDRARLERDGRELAFESALEENADGPGVLLRCSDGDLAWPVIVRQGRHRYLKLRPWRIDHDACLAQWRAETGRDMPEVGAWQRMRQFIDDALLSWPDCRATGYAPQQVISTAGFYDGEWRGGELVRTLDRPFHFDEILREPVTGPWTDYQPHERWVRTDDLPVDLPERDYRDPGYVYSGGGTDPPIPFSKRQVSGPGELEASVFSVTFHREEAHRTDYADFADGSRRLRLTGVRSAVSINGFWPLDLDAPSEGKWRTPGGYPVAPDLASWRTLRDACESGLRFGEQVTVTGTWIFERFFAGAQRKTEFLR